MKFSFFFLISVASVSQSAQPGISFCFVLNFDASAAAANSDEMGPASLFFLSIIFSLCYNHGGGGADYARYLGGSPQSFETLLHPPILEDRLTLHAAVSN